LNRIQPLYQLQSLDSELDRANKQLTEVIAALGESEALQKAKAATERAEQEFRKAQTTARDLDLEVNSLVEKIARQEKALYGGRAMSAKEAANLQEEVASLKRWHEKREELLLEAMVAVEEAEEKLDQARTTLSATQAEWQATQEDLSQKQDTLEAKVAGLIAQRPTITDVISEADLDDYENLRPKKAGRAVAVVKNGVCQGCGVAASNSKIQRARAGAELIYCSTCGRILYVP
jgi:predicted  nucleic acid-binding Zn-ribbon protein